MKLQEPLLLLLFFLLTNISSAQANTEYTILFKGRVKVNAPAAARNDIQKFFGTTLGRKIEKHDNFDRVQFDGDGFVAFVYFDDPEMVLRKEDFIKSMQVGLLVPKTQYQAVKKAIQDAGIEPMLPNEKRYQDHSKYFYFHAPGHQVFRIVKDENLEPLKTKTSSYDAEKAREYGADKYGMKKFVLTFLKRGPNKDLDDAEKASLQTAHLKNINRMAEEGALILAGPFFGDGDLRGIYLFNVDSIEKAKALTETDPAIQAGSLIMEHTEWYGSAALIAIPELHKTLEEQNVVEE